ncbi:hypothetical protein DSL92_07260 [Billgrantia gudaonensis]|uniref:Uncharacterized protein n=1 Tax=Billgrantia gudaonensis TaxID=376427 RepID=A0A3S0R4Q6_9GAMM|nr:hypothetical protein DSL92_07260 [Halomonas gudaonensis]
MACAGHARRRPGGQPCHEARFHPILYVRGFAMRDSRSKTPFIPLHGVQSQLVPGAAGAGGELHTLLFESPVVRLMKDYGYRDIYQDGAVHEGELPSRSLLIHRYYEDAAGRRRPRSSRRPTISRHGFCGCAIGYAATIPRRERRFGSIWWPSMGGLICRCLLQNEAVGDAEARACVDKVFTYGTPTTASSGRLQRAALSRRVGYRQLQPRDHGATSTWNHMMGVNHLGGRFPPSGSSVWWAPTIRTMAWRVWPWAHER